MNTQTDAARRAFAPRRVLVRATHRGFLLGDKLEEVLTGRIVGTQLLRKLFEDGEHERRQADRMRQMDDDLREFRKKKPPNPFGDD